MQVLLNTSYNNFNRMPFGSSESKNSSAKKYTQKQIITAGTKKVVSECTTVAIGLSILYFAMKRNFRHNGVKNEQKKMMELAKNKIPAFTVNKDALKPFLQ